MKIPGLTGVENHPDQSHILEMTNVKKVATDADRKAFENWDNEGGAPTSRKQALPDNPERTGDATQFAKRNLDRTERTTVAGRVKNIEQHPDGRLVFNICVNGPERKMDLVVSIQDKGTVARNDEAVLRTALRFAEDLANSLRQRLEKQVAEMKPLI
ncbi:hypothetical protein SS37A_12310 [Methylocystis iwaonis]|uniref:Uncharacterized protein n=1 Tax=Methylocystis iwaonis TaxID=2885079 RepID=A0ABM8E785_9HYPH|nr:hypothetical protein SS37A_12310 [Methylocystis iwaonis]